MSLVCLIIEKQVQLAPIISAIIAALIVVIGWITVAYFNRKNEIAKELRSYRINMLCSVFEFRNEFINAEPEEYNPKLFEIAYSNILLYGKKDEFEYFESMRESMETLPDLATDEETAEFLNSIQKMSDLCIERIRKELKLEEIKEIYTK